VISASNHPEYYIICIKHEDNHLILQVIPIQGQPVVTENR
jgi:hypothetical protein